jgi:hypothetical protein
MDVLDALEKKARVLKGLVMPDREQRWEDEEPPWDKTAQEDARLGAMDDYMHGSHQCTLLGESAIQQYGEPSRRSK